MKKLKNIIIILIVFILLAMLFFAIDYSRVQKQKKPIFCIKNPAGEINDGGTVEYFGLGYKVIDFNRLDGYNEIKIGLWSMNYYDFAEEIEKEADIIQSDEENNKYEEYLYGIEIKSVDKFNLVFYQKTMIKAKQIETIIKKDEIKNIDYNVYAFEGHVAININSDSSELTESSISLREALLQNKITMDEIIRKADKDFPNAVSYDDGGSTEYHYDNYTIIKMHKLDGNRDVYIGTNNMTLNDLSQ